MNQTHPLYLVAEGFIQIEGEQTSEGFGKIRVSNPDRLPINVVSNESNDELFVVNKDTLEGISINVLIEKGYIRMKKNYDDGSGGFPSF